MSAQEITFNTNLSEAPRTRADFTYMISPTVISIVDTGLGKCSVTEDIEAVLRKMEYWHQGSIARFKIMCRNGKGFGRAFAGTAKQHPFLLWAKLRSIKPEEGKSRVAPEVAVQEQVLGERV